MFIIGSYSIAVFMCILTMICWGSWANTQKLTTTPFQLFYWDYGIGVLLLSLIAAFTLGSHGDVGRSFIVDLTQASGENIGLALLSGVIFNLANLLLVAAIDIAGMSVAFPIAIGLALVLGVIINYLAQPLGNPMVLGIGVILVVVAMIFSANAYARMSKGSQQSSKLGIIVSLISGILMGLFFRFVAASMSTNFITPDSGKLTPYTASVIFACGVVLSSFIFNTWMIKKPLVGKPLSGVYYSKLSLWAHFVGILGGAIWAAGTLLSLLASDKAGFAISYGLGQGATMIAALWGVFVWREFKTAPAGTNWRLTLMFLAYLIGLILIVVSKVA
jgi:glucose uptake protein